MRPPHFHVTFFSPEINFSQRWEDGVTHPAPKVERWNLCPSPAPRPPGFVPFVRINSSSGGKTLPTREAQLRVLPARARQAKQMSPQL